VHNGNSADAAVISRDGSLDLGGLWRVGGFFARLKIKHTMVSISPHASCCNYRSLVTALRLQNGTGRLREFGTDGHTEGVVVGVEEEVVVVDVSVVDVSTVVCTFSVSVTLGVAFVVGDVI
jgi:hypothetical protein